MLGVNIYEWRCFPRGVFSGVKFDIYIYIYRVFSIRLSIVEVSGVQGCFEGVLECD